MIPRSGVLAAFDIATGERIWEAVAGNPPGVRDFGYVSSPAIARGHVYLGTQHDGFVSIGQPGERVKPTWSGERGGSHQGALGRVPIPEFADFLWQFPEDRQGEDTTACVVCEPALVGSYAIVPLSGLGAESGVACVKYDGDAPEVLWRHRDAAGVSVPPAVIGTVDGDPERVFVVTGSTGSADRSLVCLDGTGAVCWSRPVSPDSGGALVVGEDFLLAETDKAGSLTCLSLDGTAAWTTEMGGKISAPLLSHSLVVIPINGSPCSIAVLDRHTGRELRRVVLSTDRVLTTFWHREQLYAMTAEGVLHVPVAADDCIACFGGPPATTGVLNDGQLWYVTASNKLVSVRLDDRTVTECAVASPVVAPLAVAGKIIYWGTDMEPIAGAAPSAGSDQVFAANPLNGDGLNWLGTPSTSPVSARGRVLIGMRGWGLCVLGRGQ